MSSLIAPVSGPASVFHLKRQLWWLALGGLVTAACNSAQPPQQQPAPPPSNATGARDGASLWVQASQRPDAVDAAARLVAAIARSTDVVDRVSDGRKAGLSAALLLGPLAEADTVVTGRVTGVRRGGVTSEGVRRPITVVSLSVTGVVRGQPPAALEYWTWREGSAEPTAGAEVLVGLRSRRPDAETHMLWSPGAQFAVRGGTLELAGLRLGTEHVARSLAELEGGRP
ncbi:MAG TPA: hypothetical protein VK698_08590 [Kofleriaceae bacterium]|nr:hypothetical protein [Kofleriaceae bacterium]